MVRHRDFEKLLFESIDEGLSSLGESAKQSIYYHLEKGYGLRKQEIPHKVDDFSTAIQAIFGSGTKFLEGLILNKLHEKSGEIFDLTVSQNLSLPKSVEYARRRVGQRKRQRLKAKA